MDEDEDGVFSGGIGITVRTALAPFSSPPFFIFPRAIETARATDLAANGTELTEDEAVSGEIGNPRFDRDPIAVFRCYCAPLPSAADRAARFPPGRGSFASRRD